jgi:esterase
MLHYRVLGQGHRALLLLHGLLVSGRHLSVLGRAWAGRDSRCRVVLPDLPGHGASPALGAGASLESCAEDVRELLDELSLFTPVPIIGHSLGGRVALQMRLSHPERVGPIQLLDVTPGPVTSTDGPQLFGAWLKSPPAAESAEAMQRHLEAGGLSAEQARWLLLNGTASPAGFHWAQDRSTFSQFYLRTRTTDLWSAVQSARGVTQVIRGELSPHVSAADQVRLSALGAEVMTLPGSGHVMHFDRPRLLAEMSQRMLQRHLSE